MPDMIKKQFIGKAEVDEDERTITATISTNIVDREHEVLLPKGAEFENYMRNPVVLWAHDYKDTPIAKTKWIKGHPQGRPKEVRALMKFADTEKADEIYQLYKDGFLKAFSVGFMPKETHHPTPEEIKKHPEWAEAQLIYDKWELLEFSAVPVPANPEALAVAVKELSVSTETQEELGIEEVWHVPDDKDEETTTNTETCEKEIEGEEKVEIQLAKPIKMRKPFKAEGIINTNSAVERAMTRLGGKVY